MCSGNFSGGNFEFMHLRVQHKLHTRITTVQSKACSKFLTITGTILREPQTADELFRNVCQSWLVLNTLWMINHLVLHTTLLKRGQISSNGIHPFLIPEQLNRTFSPMIKVQRHLLGHFGEATTAIFRNSQHSSLVDAICLFAALPQH